MHNGLWHRELESGHVMVNGLKPWHAEHEDLVYPRRELSSIGLTCMCCNANGGREACSVSQVYVINEGQGIEG
jgi:hypothetical protein